MAAVRARRCTLLQLMHMNMRFSLSLSHVEGGSMEER